MSVIRAFIAIDLTSEIRTCLDQVIGQLRKGLEGVPIRWVPAENIHLTLKFLGDVSVSNLDMLKKILQTEVSSHNPFEFSVGGLWAFPSVRHPRVLWIGVEAPPELSVIQHGIELAMERLGYQREDKPFSPHLTVGRVSRNATAKDVHSISALLETTRVGFLGAANVTEIHLYRSELKPSGAIYSQIYTAALKTGE